MKALQIRRATSEDAQGIAAIYAPIVLETAMSFEVVPPTPEDMRKRMEETGADYPWLVISNRGLVVGFAYAGRHKARAAYHWSADVSIYLASDYRRQGHGSRLYSALFSLLQRQNVRSIYAGITLPNDASVALHRAMGMREVGIYRNVGFKLDAWRDVIWMGMSFDDDQPPQGPPIKFDALPASVVSALLSV